MPGVNGVVDESMADRSTDQPSTLTPVQPRRSNTVRSVLHRVTKMFTSSGPDDEPAPVERRKSHYRRGSILLKHLEEKKATGKATEKDMKFFEMIKSQFDSNSMESRTIISLSVFQTGANPLDDPFAVTHMPVEIQQGFRRKLFAIFSMQLFAVAVLISVLTHVPLISDTLDEFFTQWHYVFLTFIAMVAALLWLYLVKYRFPLNFFVLAVYTASQSMFFAGLDLFWNTKVSIFSYTFLFGVMAITTFVSTRIARRPIDSSKPAVLISYPMALLCSFFIVLVVAMLVYFLWLEKEIAALPYSASLATMLLLVMWFAYDSSCMNERLSPDEYMQGMVFFYTDMVLFLLFLSIIFVACFACEGDCACYGTADIAPIGTAAGGEDGDDVDYDDGSIADMEQDIEEAGDTNSNGRQADP